MRMKFLPATVLTLLFSFCPNVSAFDMPKTVEFDGQVYTRATDGQEYEKVIKHDVNADGRDETIIRFSSDDTLQFRRAFTQIYQTVDGKDVLVKTISSAETPQDLQFIDVDKDGVDDIVIFDHCGNHYTVVMIYSFKSGEYNRLFDNGTACYVYEVKAGEFPTRVVIGRENWADEEFSYASSDTKSLLEVWEWDGKEFVYSTKLSTSPLTTEAEAVEASWQQIKKTMDKKGGTSSQDKGTEFAAKSWISGRRLEDIKKNEKAKGRDWLLMPDNEKALYVLTAMDGMQKEGVLFFGKSPNEYIKEIDKRLADNPSLASKDLLNIVIPIIYESMPGYGEEVDKIKK